MESKTQNLASGKPNIPCEAEFMAKWRMLPYLFFACHKNIEFFKKIGKFSKISIAICGIVLRAKIFVFADSNSSAIFLRMVNENLNKKHSYWKLEFNRIFFRIFSKIHEINMENMADLSMNLNHFTIHYEYFMYRSKLYN